MCVGCSREVHWMFMRWPLDVRVGCSIAVRWMIGQLMYIGCVTGILCIANQCSLDGRFYVVVVLNNCLLDLSQSMCLI